MNSPHQLLQLLSTVRDRGMDMGSGDAQRLITELRTAWRVARDRVAAAASSRMTTSQVEAAAAQDGDYLAKRETVSEFLRAWVGTQAGFEQEARLCQEARVG